MDKVDSYSFDLAHATVAVLEYVLRLAEDGHTALSSNGVVAEQVHLDEADAQSDTESGVALLSYWAALKLELLYRLMIELFVEGFEVLKIPDHLQGPVSWPELFGSACQRGHCSPRYGDQC